MFLTEPQQLFTLHWHPSYQPGAGTPERIWTENGTVETFVSNRCVVVFAFAIANHGMITAFITSTKPNRQRDSSNLSVPPSLRPSVRLAGVCEEMSCLAEVCTLKKKKAFFSLI